MSRYRDATGAEVEAVQIDAPCILTTAVGECAAEPGCWLVSVPGIDRPFVFAPDAFGAAFTAIEEQP